MKNKSNNNLNNKINNSLNNKINQLIILNNNCQIKKFQNK